MTFLVHVPGAERHGSAFITIEGPSFFLARASAAVAFGVEPCEVRPAERRKMVREPGA